MKTGRQFFLNDRVRAAFTLLGVMSGATVLVFFGIESLKLLPSLSPEQRQFLAAASFPPAFKLLVIFCFNGIAVMAAYVVLSYRYSGFFNRLHNHFEALRQGEVEDPFRFRQGDKTEIFRDSMETLLEGYRKKIWELEAQAIALKQKLHSLLRQ